jgi:hypothetical protein
MYGWIASVQTPDGILLWFGINPESHTIFKIKSRKVIGQGESFSNYFVAARTMAVGSIRKAQQQSREAANNTTLPKQKVVPATWHHKYGLAGTDTE